MISSRSKTTVGQARCVRGFCGRACGPARCGGPWARLSGLVGAVARVRRFRPEKFLAR